MYSEGYFFRGAVRFDFASPETAAPFPFWTLKTEYPLVKYVLFAASVQSGTPWPVFQRAKFIDFNVHSLEMNYGILRQGVCRDDEQEETDVLVSGI